jgi:hypothetical protein
MPVAYQKAFETLYGFVQDTPGTRIQERTDEWDAGGGRHREVHINHMINVEGHWEQRPYMLIFQDDPPNPGDRGLELFFSAMKLKGEFTVTPKRFFSFFTSNRVKPCSTNLKAKLVFTCPGDQRETVQRMLDNPELEELLMELPWDRIQSIEFQDASGISLHLRAEVVLEVSQPWLEDWLGRLAQMVLCCE